MQIPVPCKLHPPQEQRKKEEAAEKAAADKEGDAKAADAKPEAAAAEEEKEEPIPEPQMPSGPQLQVGGDGPGAAVGLQAWRFGFGVVFTPGACLPWLAGSPLFRSWWACLNKANCTLLLFASAAGGLAPTPTLF